MEETKKRKRESLLFRILMLIVIILLFIYFGISFDILKFNNDTCSKYINPLNISYVDGTNEWASDCKRIKVENFEVDVREYSFDNGKTWQESNIYQVCNEGIVEVKIRDAKKKILGEGTFNVANIDNIPPELEIDKDLTIKVGNAVDLIDGVTASDKQSGLKGGIRITPSDINIWQAGETIVNYTATDNAGNKTTKSRKIIVTGTLNVTTFYLTPSHLYLKKGDTYTLKPVYYPSNLSSNLITWKSSDEKVVSVDKKGNLIAKENGTVYINAQMGNKNYVVFVTVGTSENMIINPTTAHFSSGNYIVKVGETITPGIILSPNNAVRNFSYLSYNTDIATYKNGVVKGIKPGTTQISITTSNGKVATAQITVIHKNNPSNTTPISIKLPDKVIVEPQQTKKLDIEVLPSNATGYTVTCSSNNTGIATIDGNYNIKGISIGNAVVTCKISNGLTANTIVVVDNGITNLKINPSSLDLVKGNTKQLTFDITPSTMKDTVTCTSSNASIATINNSNIVTGVQTGTALITCKTSNGVSASINVSVNPNTVTMYRYRDSSTKSVQCNCREEATGKCDYHYDCGCTNKWVCTSTLKGGCPCQQGDTRCGEWKKTCTSKCCHAYVKETVCSTCKETVWSNWSEWSTTKVTATSTRQVETKQVEQ